MLPYPTELLVDIYFLKLKVTCGLTACTPGSALVQYSETSMGNFTFKKIKFAPYLLFLIL